MVSALHGFANAHLAEGLLEPPVQLAGDADGHIAAILGIIDREAVLEGQVQDIHLGRIERSQHIGEIGNDTARGLALVVLWAENEKTI